MDINLMMDGPTDNSNDIPIMSLQRIALASQQMALAASQQTQPQIMHQQPFPYPSNGHNAAEIASQGAYAINPFSSMIPINSQWPASNALPSTANNVPSTSGVGISNGMERLAPANGSMNAYPYMNAGNSDESYGMLPIMSSIPNFTPFPVVNNMDPIVPMFNNLEPITITHAVLTPPLPGKRRNRCRPKPPGCRTVFVGSLPITITEEIIREAFTVCGPISAVRMSRKNFCHIRFVNMESVNQALLLSDFGIRIDNSDDPACNGRLFVDYAVARDDQHDYECLERARLREEHHQKEAFRTPSPLPVPHFSEREAQILAERLYNDETFQEGLQLLITWLDNEECNKRNSGTFYSLIESSHRHVKRLRNKIRRYEDEAEKAQENLININRSIARDVNEIEKVFVAAKTPRVWDHFTRSQRKMMEEMKNDTCDLKQMNFEDLLGHRIEEEFELSDNEENEGDRIQLVPADELSVLRERVNHLNEELEIAHQTIREFEGLCDKHLDEIAKLRLELKESKMPGKSGNGLPVNFDNQYCFKDGAAQYRSNRVITTENVFQLVFLIFLFFCMFTLWSIDYLPIRCYFCAK